MLNIFVDIIFTIFTLFVFLKSLSFGIYEINQENNKSGGITVIFFSLACILFSNVMVWLL